MKTLKRRGAKMQSKKQKPISVVQVHFKLANTVSALGDLTDQMAGLAKAFIHGQKHGFVDLPKTPRLRASAVKKGVQ